MRRLSLGLLVLLLPLWALAANTQEYTLSNGLKLIVREDHRAPVVFVSVWYKVGGSYEHDGITGISHVLEHMMFRGTKRYGPGEFDRIINRIGGRDNAITSADYTMYYEELANNHLATALKLEADRMRGLALKDTIFKKEIQVVMEERRLRLEDNPQALTWERFQAAVYVNSPYHHPVIGWMTDLQHLTLADLKKWYSTWYAPNNAVVVVVGDVQPQAVLALAKRYFSNLKSSPLPKEKPRTEVSALGMRRVVVNAPAKLPWLVLGYNVPVLTTAKQKWQAYALVVLSGILDAGNSSRFARELIRGQQIAASAATNYDIYHLHSALLTLMGIPAKGHSVVALEKALLQQIRSLQTQLVSEQELNRVKAQVIAQNIYGKDSLANQAFDIGLPEMAGLSWRDSQQFVTQIKAITAVQIREVAKRYLIQKNLTIGLLKPEPIMRKP